MLPDLSAIKKRRLGLGKTQKQLANLCDLSQSVITKIETNRINPSYSVARRIFEILDTLEEKSLRDSPNINAKGIMTRMITSVRPTDMIQYAIDVMLKKNFSQLPVMRGDKVVGRITDKMLVTHPEFVKKKVGDIMAEPFPILPANSRLSTIQAVLTEEPAVLISDEKSKIVGIITKHDLIKAVRIPRF